jgi:hypothetical protein
VAERLVPLALDQLVPGERVQPAGWQVAGDENSAHAALLDAYSGRLIMSDMREPAVRGYVDFR